MIKRFKRLFSFAIILTLVFSFSFIASANEVQEDLPPQYFTVHLGGWGSEDAVPSSNYVTLFGCCGDVLASGVLYKDYYFGALASNLGGWGALFSGYLTPLNDCELTSLDTYIEYSGELPVLVWFD